MRQQFETVSDLGVCVEVTGRAGLPELTARVDAACNEVEDGDEPGVVVLALPGSPGADRSWPGVVSMPEVTRWERALRRLERTPAVTVAVAAGHCVGPALDVLLTADYRIATTEFELLLPVNEGHFWPGMGMFRLTRQVGGALVRRIVLWGDRLSAARAQEIGLVDELTGDVDEAVRGAAVLLGRAAGAELAVRRQLLLEAASATYEEALGAHLAACDRELRRLRGEQ